MTPFQPNEKIERYQGVRNRVHFHTAWTFDKYSINKEWLYLKEFPNTRFKSVNFRRWVEVPLTEPAWTKLKEKFRVGDIVSAQYADYKFTGPIKEIDNSAKPYLVYDEVDNWSYWIYPGSIQLISRAKPEKTRYEKINPGTLMKEELQQFSDSIKPEKYQFKEGEGVKCKTVAEAIQLRTIAIENGYADRSNKDGRINTHVSGFYWKNKEFVGDAIDNITHPLTREEFIAKVTGQPEKKEFVNRAFPVDYVVPKGTRVKCIRANDKVGILAVGITIDESKSPYIKFDNNDFIVPVADKTWAVNSYKLQPVNPLDHPEHPDFGKPKTEPEKKLRLVTDLTEKECIHAKTEAEAIAICKLMDEAGLTWSTGGYYVENPYYAMYGEHTCYDPKLGERGHVDWYKNENYTIYSASDFIQAGKVETQQPKIGDQVEGFHIPLGFTQPVSGLERGIVKEIYKPKHGRIEYVFQDGGVVNDSIKLIRTAEQLSESTEAMTDLFIQLAEKNKQISALQTESDNFRRAGVLLEEKVKELEKELVESKAKYDELWQDSEDVTAANGRMQRKIDQILTTLGKAYLKQLKGE